MSSLSQQQRAERVREVLARHNLTRHGASTLRDFSRETLNKLWHGAHVTIEGIESFAREFDLDVNEWREMWGYPRVESLPTPQQTLRAFWHEWCARAAADGVELQPPTLSEGSEGWRNLTHEQVRRQVLSAVRLAYADAGREPPEEARG